MEEGALRPIDYLHDKKNNITYKMKKEKKKKTQHRT